MRVNNYGDPRIASIYERRVSDRTKDAVRPPADGQSDTVEISGKGKELQAYIAHLKDLCEIREERVERLKKHIRESSFRIEVDKIAAAIIAERKLDRAYRSSKAVE